MKLKAIILLLLVFKICYSQNEELSESKIKHINKIIALFKQKNSAQISEIINFPLGREYPIPSIKNKKEFTQRFNEVFDKTLIDKIANSKISQWSEMGWRGIMLNNGDLWIDSETGKITSVIYQSDFEKKLRQGLINTEKQSLHESLKKFINPTYRIQTKNYLIRIDEISTNKYRYASWKINKTETSKPDLILNNGKLEVQGSGGNHVIIFTNGRYTYKIYRNVIGTKDTPEIRLEVEKNGKTILTEDGTLLIK